MKRSRRVRQVAETALLCLGLALVPPLPRSWVVRLASWLGRAGFRISRRDRRLALANLEVAFGSRLSAPERERIAREAFRTFALVLLDLFWFGWFTRRRLRACVELDASFYYYLKTRPVIAVTGHFGNWEVLGQALALHGAPTLSVAAPLKGAFADRILNRRRRLTGQRVARREGAVKALTRELRDGGRVALLMDQNTSPRDGGLFVDFFGLKATMSKAAAVLSTRLGAEIVPMYCTVHADGRYRAYALPPFGGKHGPDAEDALTQRIAAVLEQEVSRRPGQWLWMYKRWKYIPPGADGDRYPFYAQGATREQEPGSAGGIDMPPAAAEYCGNGKEDATG